jgi:hypothetical protein
MYFVIASSFVKVPANLFQASHFALPLKSKRPGFAEIFKVKIIDKKIILSYVFYDKKNKFEEFQ